MTWGEGLRLIRRLRGDTSSQFAASCEGWRFPTSREHLAILDLFDVTVSANSDPKRGRPKPHAGRPIDVQVRNAEQYGKTGDRTDAQVIDIMRRLGHNLPAA